MTDAELIQLLESKLPQELTAAEVALVRSRLQNSPGLQKALRDRLLIDESLNQVLGEVHLEPEIILARKSSAARSAVPRWLPWGIALLLVAVAGWGLKAMLLPDGWPGALAQHAEEKPNPEQPAPTKKPITDDPPEYDPANVIPPPKPGEAIKLNTAVRPGWLVFEAEHFQNSQNINVKSELLGKYIAAQNAEVPARVDYEFDVPESGDYVFEMQYRSIKSVRFEIEINGQPVTTGRVRSMGAPTSPKFSGDPASGWVRLRREFPFKAGKNTLSIVNPGHVPRSYYAFPDFDRFALQTLRKLNEAEKTALTTAEPWNDARYLGAPPRPFLDLAHEHHRYWGPPLTKSGFREWFKPFDGFKSETSRRWDTSLVTLDGATQLRAPLSPDHLLRLAISETNNQFRLHIWNGLQGYSLQLYDWQYQSWIAYRVERKKLTDARPSKYEFAASDDKHYFLMHAQDQPHRIELRCAEARLTLSHAGVTLLDLPWDGPEPEVVLDTRGVLHGLALHRVSDAGPPPLPAAPAVTTTWDKPADREWFLHEGNTAKWTKRPDGSVQLDAAERPDKDAWATTALDLKGPSIIDCEVEVIEPGAKLILATKENIPRYAIASMKDRRTGQNLWLFHSALDPNFESDSNIPEQPAALSGSRAWLRIVQGAGVVRVWLSTDGETWGRAFDASFDTEGGCERIGLLVTKGDRPRGIILHSVTIRELPLLTAMVPADLLAKTPRLKYVTKPEEWAEQVTKSRPADVEQAAWWRACALKTVLLGQGRQVANPLLFKLIDEAWAAIPAGNDPAAQQESLAKKLALLREAAWISSAIHQPELYQPRDFLPARYDELARMLALNGQPDLWTKVWYEWVTSPGWYGVSRFTEWQHLAREGLLQGVYQGEVSRVRDLYHLTQTIFPRLTFLPWVENWIAGKQPNSLPTVEMTGEPYEARNIDRRHPYIEELSKESFNMMAELNSAIGSKALRDAAQLITQAGPQEGGLLPDARDDQLLVALPAAISLALQKEPELREVLANEYGQVGLLRFRKAELEGDLAVMQNLVNQYPGTAAAGSAYAWLGDRALSGGDFGSALANYSAALPNAPANLAAELPARQRLAAALLGREFGAPATTPVSFGESRLSPEEFEAQVRDLREQHRRASGIPTLAEQRAPLAGKLELKKLGVTDGDAGDKVGEFPEMLNLMFDQGKRFDWAARQMTVVPVGENLLWSNRYQTALYDPQGKKLWKSSLDNEHGKAHDWLFVPMKPLVVGDRVFARRLTKAGPDLAALTTNSGKLLWLTRPGLVVISDPLWINEEIRVLTINRGEQEAQIQLTSLDATNGNVIAQRPLVNVRPAWDDHHTAQWIHEGGRLYGNLTGMVFCCDLNGRMQWSRRQIWISPREDRDWPRQWMQPPVLAGQHLLVAQPGVKAVECLDPETGRLLWRRVLSDIRRVLGAADGIAVVQTESALLAFAVESGELKWKFPFENALSAYSIGDKTISVWNTKRDNPKEGPWIPECHSIDLHTGKLLATQMFDQLKGDRPLAGPLVQIQPNRWWLFTGNGDKEAQRTINEIREK
jgi:outer membrane protein assembly factor BamB